MKKKNIVLNVMLLLAFVLAACSGTAPDTMKKPEDAMMDKPTEEAMMDKPTEEAMMPHETPTADAMMMKETPTPDAMVKPTEEAMMEAPAWFSASLTDVHSGEAFTINDLKGKVVLVETMAVWCSNCFKQQTQVKALHESLGMRDDLVTIGFDIDPNEDAAQLKDFATTNGFEWKYVISPTDVSRDLSSLYGAQFLNPPSTPMLIIDRHGIAHPLPFGIKSADDLMKALQPYLDEAM
ncbi:MAG: TlpA family protein disulfide reductase [Anaerolineales bacterium]|nr:TlpA family protein disulfide reductase [Anaerolineales bacterium]